jgi:hypothetical protein
MAILSLKKAGEEATLDITNAEQVQGQYGEQVKFTTDTNDILFVPLSSVQRQLDRCGVAEVEELSGKSLHFSRSQAKNGTTVYWNIDKAREGDTKTAPKANGKPVVAQALSQNEHYVGTLPGDEVETGGPPTETSGFDTVVEKYAECFNEAAGFAQRAKTLGIPVDLAGISAVAATLFIARNQARV